MTEFTEPQLARMWVTEAVHLTGDGATPTIIGDGTEVLLLADDQIRFARKEMADDLAKQAAEDQTPLTADERLAHCRSMAGSLLELHGIELPPAGSGRVNMFTFMLAGGGAPAITKRKEYHVSDSQAAWAPNNEFWWERRMGRRGYKFWPGSSFVYPNVPFGNCIDAELGTNLGMRGLTIATDQEVRVLSVMIGELAALNRDYPPSS